MDNFAAKLKQFIDFSRNNPSSEAIRREYLKLVKEYHPDTNKDVDVDFDLANEYMRNINYAYEHLLNNETIPDKTEDVQHKEDTGLEQMYKSGDREYHNYFMKYYWEHRNNFSDDQIRIEMTGYLNRCIEQEQKVLAIDKTGEYGEKAKRLIEMCMENLEMIEDMSTDAEVTVTKIKDFYYSFLQISVDKMLEIIATHSELTVMLGNKHKIIFNYVSSYTNNVLSFFLLPLRGENKASSELIKNKKPNVEFDLWNTVRAKFLGRGRLILLEDEQEKTQAFQLLKKYCKPGAGFNKDNKSIYKLEVRTILK